MKQTFRILFIGSSNFQNRQFVDRLAGRHGVDFVSWISSGERALNAYSYLLPDVIIVDALTDDMSGVEVSRWLKEQSGKLRIVMVSETPAMEFLHVSREMGLQGYFPKSVSEKDIDNSIDELQNGNCSYHYALANMIFPRWMKTLQTTLAVKAIASQMTGMAMMRNA